MKNVKMYLALLVFSFVLLNGCSEDNITISQDDALISLEFQSKNELSLSEKGQKSFATGQGGLIFNEKHSNFSFHASKDSEGNVSGQWEAKTVGGNLRTHGTIYCLTFIDEKTAVMSGTITQVNKEDDSFLGAQVGNSIWFKVIDNGEGMTDQFSDYYIRAGDCIDYNPPLVNIENGNIQVKRKIPNLVDIEGNEYNVIQIGSQIWMAENLRTTTYNDGTPIPNVTDNTNWSNLTTPSYSWYNHDENSYGDTYGALYNWYAIDTNKLAPEGWHVASDEEWIALTEYLGGENSAGGKLKDRGFEHWDSPNTDATNEYGFTALGAGYRSKDGAIVLIGQESLWWTSTGVNSTNSAWPRWMGNNSGMVIRGIGPNNRNYGYSVRCVKD